MRVLGIDPGLRNLGWGVIEMTGSRLVHVANGIVRSAGPDLAARLLALHAGLSEVIARHAPEAAAVEQTFVNKDAVATLKLGQARGIALLAPAQAGLSVGEYAPNAVKKTIVGVGHAAKEQVAHMVRFQLPGVEIAGPDAADALAVAICHAHHLQTAGRLAAAVRSAAGRGEAVRGTTGGGMTGCGAAGAGAGGEGEAIADGGRAVGDVAVGGAA